MENKISTTKVNQLFGMKLAEARRSRGMTQADLAHMLGFSRVTIANLELGRQNVRLDQIFSAADALDVQVSQLMPTMREVTPESLSTEALFLKYMKSRLVAESEE